MRRSGLSNACRLLLGAAAVLLGAALGLAPKAVSARANLPVLLVHGIHDWGNENSSWVKAGWADKDFLRRVGGGGSVWAVYDAGAPGIDMFDSAPVYMLDYHGYEDAAGPIRPTAGILASAIEDVKRDSGASKVYVVAHSMGGLITRALIEDMAQDKDHNNKAVAWKNDIVGLVTIDTPHRGSWMAASPGGKVMDRSNGAKDMRPDSAFMQTLNSRSVDNAVMVSVAVGDHYYDGGDGMVKKDEQLPPASTVSKYESKRFDVIHGYGMGALLLTANSTPHRSKKEIPAIADQGVKDFVIAQYRKARDKYEAQLPPTEPIPQNTVLAIDHSGSMAEAWSDTDKVEGAKSAANTLVDMLQGAVFAKQPPRKIGLVPFNDQTGAPLSPTTDYAAVRDGISSLTADGGTDLIQPIEEGARQLEGVGGGTLILLTDGMDENGNSEDSIIAAADGARAKGIKIFTIGFGTPGSDIDEELLKRIAGDDSRYSYADPRSLVGLAGGFLYSELSSIFQVMLKTEGTVAQGATAQAGSFEVTGTGNLQAVLYWPGSTLDIKLKDPSGTEVATGYPGLKVVRTSPPAQLFVENAKPGTWSMSVYGAETSMDQEPFYALASFEESTMSGLPAGAGPAGSGAEIYLLFLGLGLVGGVSWLTLRGRTPAVPASDVNGPGAPPARVFELFGESGVTAVRAGVTTIGRADDNDIVLDHPTVSRYHAVIEVNGDRATVSDLNSTSGTMVNGERVTKAELQDKDTLGLGDARLMLRRKG